MSSPLPPLTKRSLVKVGLRALALMVSSPLPEDPRVVGPVRHRGGVEEVVAVPKMVNRHGVSISR
jgi:hypothetical protein